jgi:transcriptional regulator with XRE-family HTH domain
MKVQEAAEEKGRRLREALRRKIGGAGLSLRDVEGRIGLGRDYLRHLLSDRVDLKISHVLGMLEVLKLDPGAFFAEVYELPAPVRRPAEPVHPQFPSSQHRTPGGAIWFVARKLKERGILTDEDIDAFVAEFDHEQAQP